MNQAASPEAGSGTLNDWPLSLLDFPTSDKKGRPPDTKLVLLCAHIAIRQDSFCASARPDRIDKICDHIARALLTDCLTPEVASKLGGRLGFYTSLLSGKLGRGMMGPLIARQYRQRGHKLTVDLTRNLLWRYSALGNLPPRVTPFLFLSPVGAHTDAQGFGHIAAVYMNQTTEVALHLPSWFTKLVSETPVESPIFIYELCAAILMVCVSLTWPADTHRTCVLCVDNKAAVAALAKGSSSSSMGSMLATLFWTLAARGSTLRWIEYVHAKSNRTDFPSRERGAPDGRKCARSVGQCPAAFRYAFKSWYTLHEQANMVQKMKRVTP